MARLVYLFLHSITWDHQWWPVVSEYSFECPLCGQRTKALNLIERTR